nr:hypothetical protein [Actinomadura sp. J1-007]
MQPITAATPRARTSGTRPTVASSAAVDAAYAAASARAVRRGRVVRSMAWPITGPLSTYGRVIAVWTYPAVAACPVRAWTVRTSAVAIPSAEIRSSVAAPRCGASPGITLAWCHGIAGPRRSRRSRAA